MSQEVAARSPDDVRVVEARFEAFDREVGEVMGLHNAAAAQLVAIVRRCLAEDLWQVAGTHSPEHWCKVRLGVAQVFAARLVRCATGLADYPAVAAAFGRGLLSLDHVDVVVTMQPDPRFDRELADTIGVWDIARMKRIIRNFTPAPEPEPAAESAGDDDRGADPATSDGAPLDVLRAGWCDDGRFRGSFDLGPALGAQFEKAIGIARGALFTERTGVADDDDDRQRQPSTVSTVDALHRLLQAALDGLDPSIAAGRRPSDRTQVIVHVDAEHPERSRIHLGPLLPAALRRELSCESHLRLALEREGNTFALGRRRRTVDTLLRMVIEERDQGCRVAGCGRRGFLHVHHLVHWEDGGPTAPDNLCCLCPEHHRMVHAGKLKLIGDPEQTDGLVTLDHRGRPLPQPGPLPPAEPLPNAPSRYEGTYWGQRAQLTTYSNLI